MDPPDCAEEEEPRLKYQRLGAEAEELLADDRAVCLCVSDKLLALGLSKGSVHLLDYEGNEVKRFRSHGKQVNCICFDKEAEFVASCSSDGTVAINSLYTDDKAVFKYNQAVQAVALDPRYGSRKTREFVTGGRAGQLLLNSRGWLGSRDTILHAGEGPVQAVQWAGSLLAWANNVGVKVYDMASHKQVASFPHQKSSLQGSGARCHIFWHQATTLFFARGSSIQVAKVMHSQAAGSIPDPQITLQLAVQFETEYIVSGLAPYGDHLAVLAHRSSQAPERPARASDGGLGAAANGHPPSILTGHGEMPELKMLTMENQEVASDQLTIEGYEGYGAQDYTLAACQPAFNSALRDGSATASTSRSASETPWWTGDEPLYYIVSPKAVVVARAMDSYDRLRWLQERCRFEQALEVAERDPTLKPASRAEVAERFLGHLLATRQYVKAAALTPDLLKEDAGAWERWILMFGHARQTAQLAPFIPTSDPTLRSTAYDMVLEAFIHATANHSKLLQLVRLWPPTLYNLPGLTEKVLERMRRLSNVSDTLLQVAAHLYQAQGRYDLALSIQLRLRSPKVFDFIRAHGLLPQLPSRVPQLLRIDASQAIHLLVEEREAVSPSAVVPAIQAELEQSKKAQDQKQAEQWRKWLHMYLDELFQNDSSAGAEFHALQVELYAEYNPKRLMPFLMTSQAYSLEAALQQCEGRGLVREQVFLLGRMGNSVRALDLIIQQLADIPGAIAFIQGQRDDDLWEHLITLALEDAAMIGELLEHLGVHVEPKRVVERIPKGMAIPHLRERLVRIMHDFRTQASLREGCNTILSRDCILLAQRLYREPGPGPTCGRAHQSRWTLATYRARMGLRTSTWISAWPLLAPPPPPLLLLSRIRYGLD
ncbi:hypothetical protein WJX84_004897 [Apatococcus fuscideae]|uniref:Vps41 beta-propeller domain-containing protein n=1 Tax=Apatococcus fuscideae TaxID=2026836 RepID=A0AAW1T7C1_9CHLO